MRDCGTVLRKDYSWACRVSVLSQEWAAGKQDHPCPWLFLHMTSSLLHYYDPSERVLTTGQTDGLPDGGLLRAK